jgi:hypothetical protein
VNFYESVDFDRNSQNMQSQFYLSEIAKVFNKASVCEFAEEITRRVAEKIAFCFAWTFS